MPRAQQSFFGLIALTGSLAILSSTMSKTPVLPLFASSLGATPAEIGWIVAASTLPGILVSYPAGALSDFVGRYRVIMLSLIIFATAPLFYLWVHNVWELAAVRFYHGFATAIFGTITSAAIAQRYTQNRAEKLSTYSSTTLIGRSIAPFLGGALITLSSFNGVYLACTLSGTLALLTGLFLKDALPVVSEKEMPALEKNTLSGLLKNKLILKVSLVEACQYLVFGSVETFLALYAATTGIPPWQIGIILGIQLTGIVFLKPFMGKMSDRVGRHKIIISGLLVGAFSVMLFAFTHEFFGLTVLSFFFGVGFATVTSSTSALVADLTPNDQYGSSIGLLRTLMDIGQMSGPVLTGWVVSTYNYPYAFILLSTILIVAWLALPSLPPSPNPSPT